MAKTGAHFSPCNVGSVEKHNERNPEYLKSVEASGRNLYFFQELTPNNTSWVNPDYGGKTCSDIFKDMVKLYTEKVGQAPQLNDRERINKKTGRKYKVAGWSPIREAVIPIKADTTIEDFKPIVDWLKSKGWNVIRIDLHKDEGHKNQVTGERKMNYHAHLVADCLDWKTGRTVKLSNDDMSLKGIQGIIAEALGMERGKKKEVTGAEHRDMWQQKEYAASRNFNRLDIQVKGLSKMIENLNKNKADILQEIEDLKKQADDGKITQEQLDKEISARQSKLDDIEGRLQDKTQKLRTAEQQLAEITRRRLEADREYHALQRAINKDQTTLQDRTLRDISATGWDIATEETRKLQERLYDFRKDLNDDDREALDDIFHGSIVEDLAERGNEIAAVATALSLGYVKEAVTFAESHGGGGCGPEGGWGKDPWEDEDKWRKRCFHMARTMMRPAKGRVVQRSGGFHR